MAAKHRDHALGLIADFIETGMEDRIQPFMAGMVLPSPGSSGGEETLFEEFLRLVRQAGLITHEEAASFAAISKMNVS